MHCAPGPHGLGSHGLRGGSRQPTYGSPEIHETFLRNRIKRKNIRIVGSSLSVWTLALELPKTTYQHNLVDRSIVRDYLKHNNQHFYHMDRVDKVQVLQRELYIAWMDCQLVVLDTSKRDFVMNRTQHPDRKDSVRMDSSAQRSHVLCWVIQYSRVDMYIWRNRCPILNIELLWNKIFV